MRSLVIIFVISIGFFVNAQSNPIDIRFKKNVEFLGYIIELGDPSYNDPNHSITKEINRFPQNRSSEHLAQLYSMAGNMDYSTLVNLIYFLPELPLKERHKFSAEDAESLGFHSEEEQLKLQKLIDQINKFYIESNFEVIWKNLEPERENIKLFLEENRPSDTLMNSIELFYGNSFDTYEIVPSLTLWSAGWGIKHKENKKATFVLGPLKKNYDFNDKENFKNLAIHEFGHSFVNHIVLENKEQLLKTRSLYEPLEAEMSKQGYSDWETCMIEHFVRSGEVIVREILGDSEVSQALVEDYVENRKFIYLPLIIENLMENRLDAGDSYPESVKTTLTALESYLLEK